MRIHHIATSSLIGLLAVLAFGCSRMTAVEEAEVRQSFDIPADMPMKDLGVVELRAGIPKRVRVGWGKHCTITATVRTNGSVRMNLLYESKGEVIDGVKTQSHSERSQSVFPPGMLCQVIPGTQRLLTTPGDRGWFCLPPMGQHLVVALRPIIIP